MPQYDFAALQAQERRLAEGWAMFAESLRDFQGAVKDERPADALPGWLARRQLR